MTDIADIQSDVPLVVGGRVIGLRVIAPQRSGEATTFPLVDGHCDVTAITNATAEVESRQSFDPWGNQLSGPSLEMGYLGAWERPTDPATSLIQMGARSYDPALGSFASEDPVLGHLGIGVSVNRYPYVWDNPLNRYDLKGRDVCILGACAGEAATDIGHASSSLWEHLNPHENMPTGLEDAEDLKRRAPEFVKAVKGFFSELNQNLTEAERMRAAINYALGQASCEFAQQSPEEGPPGEILGTGAEAWCLSSKYLGAAEIGSDLGSR